MIKLRKQQDMGVGDIAWYHSQCVSGKPGSNPVKYLLQVWHEAHTLHPASLDMLFAIYSLDLISSKSTVN